MKLKGIALKMFMITVVIMITIISVSFLVLYLVLPSYYLGVKRKTLDFNIEKLEKEIVGLKSEQEVRELLGVFNKDNNAFAFAFDGEGKSIDSFSSYVTFMYNENGVPSINEEEIVISPTYYNNIADVNIDGESLGYSYNVSLTQIGNEIEEYTIDSEMVKILNIGEGYVKRVEVITTLQPIDEATEILLGLLPYVLLVDSLVVLLFSYYYARKMTDPIIKISEVTKEMQEIKGNLECGIESGDEIGELSKNIDNMYKNLCRNVEDLEKQVEKVTRVERTKTDFMNAASHELKTPIGALYGIVEGMIDNVGVYKDKEKYLVESKKQIEKLGMIVEEILQSSRMEFEGKEEEGEEEVEIGEMVRAILEDNLFLIEDRKMDIVSKVGNLRLIVDRGKKSSIHLVLSNLIVNAIKHGREGSEVCIEKLENEGFLISNESQEISQEEVVRLFEAFYTVNYSRDRRSSGTGLGLYIVGKNLDRLGFSYKAWFDSGRFWVFVDFGG